jgi:hypothetical protein
MVYLKNLMLSRPYLQRIPDQTLLLSGSGQGGSHVRATRADTGQYAFIYIPIASQAVLVDLTKLAGPTIQAWWYNPRTGESSAVGEFTCQPQTFTTPAKGSDWILVLDSTSENFPAPGIVNA